MKDCTPDGCKMYVAINDIDFLTLHEFGQSWLHVQKGDVWMLNQITSEGQVWLDKSWNSTRTLKISQEQLESDFVEVNLNEVNMDTIYSFEDDYCTETVMLNGYEVKSDTFSWAFDDFCDYMGYPLSEWIH